MIKDLPVDLKLKSIEFQSFQEDSNVSIHETHENKLKIN